ncbi:porin [Paraburkholderia sp.]|uniref:porin n=1 Tax=Paraburkholderia sp. TaxID=1926495 RepID=UPI003D6EA8D2
MTRKLLFFAVLSCGSTAAWAQSSVTLYGLLDNGVTYVTNAGGSHQVLEQSTIMRGNRWGVVGQEALGGGIAAIFRLESGFGVENGTLAQGGREFGRQAYVGMTSPYGTITLGRQYDFVVDYVGVVGSSALFNTAYAFHIGDIDRISGGRSDSAVKYVTPDYHGLTLGAMYAFGDLNTPGATGRTVSFGARYQRGNFTAGAVYTAVYEQVMPLAAYFGTTTLFGRSIGTVNPKTGAIVAANVNVDRTQTVAVGANYRWQKFGLYGMVTGTNIQVGGNSGNFMTYEMTGQYSPTPWLSFSAGYEYETFQGMKYGLAAATVDYRFSKATDVYLSMINMHAYSGAYADILGLATSTSSMQSTIRVGVMHLF